jgi:hypothetical protein
VTWYCAETGDLVHAGIHQPPYPGKPTFGDWVLVLRSVRAGL